MTMKLSPIIEKVITEGAEPYCEITISPKPFTTTF